MATAELKAVLGIDSKDYETGIKKVTGETRSFQSEIQKSGQALRQTSKVVSGFQQIAAGNFAQGIASMIGGLTKLGDKAAAVTVQIGAAFAAFGAGYQIGKRLDEMLGLSDRISRAIVGPIDRGLDQSDPVKAAREANRERWDQMGGEERAAAVRKEMEDDLGPMASQREKLEKEYGNKIAEEKAKQAKVTTDVEYKAHQERIVQLEQFYAQELVLLDRAEREKEAKAKQALSDDEARRAQAAEREQQRAVAAQKRIDDAVAKEQETTAKRIAAVRGREFTQTGQGIRVDSMAATGGLVGGGRAGLQQKSKELQVAMESLRRQVEIKTIQQESLNTQREIRDRLQPTGAPL